MALIRLLEPQDEAPLDAFLSRHAASSLFLRSNLRLGGLVDRGEVWQGTYAAAFEAGEVMAVAAHYWNGMLVLQVPAYQREVASLALRSSGRALKGVIGPWSQADSVRGALRLDRAPTQAVSHEDLFSLELADLVVPDALQTGSLTCRHAIADDLGPVAEWRRRYVVEVGLEKESHSLADASRAEVEHLCEHRSLFVLEDAGERVAMSAFNARLPDCVQIGGVWTPPHLRGRGYARAVVAGSLLIVRHEGVRSSVLFTDQRNAAARRAYEALGYRLIGDYAIIVFAQEGLGLRP